MRGDSVAVVGLGFIVGTVALMVLQALGHQINWPVAFVMVGFGLLSHLIARGEAGK